MKIQKITNGCESDIIDAGGGYCLTAENKTIEEDNRVVSVLVEMMHRLAACGQVSEYLANSHGCLTGLPGQYRNFVYLPGDAFVLEKINTEVMDEKNVR